MNATARRLWAALAAAAFLGSAITNHAGNTAARNALWAVAAVLGIPVVTHWLFRTLPAAMHTVDQAAAQAAAAAPPARLALAPQPWGHTTPMALSCIRAPLTPPTTRPPAAPPLPR